MNNVVFSTGGDWESTTLYNNGEEFAAAQLFVELHAGQDDYGEPAEGGVSRGGEISAILRPQDDPENQMGIFPGRLEMGFPGHSVIIENTHPGFQFEFTRVWYNGVDVTNHVNEIYVDINAVDNVVRAYITIYKNHWFRSDEVATYTIL